jgi:hypothetical protein
MYNCIMCNLSVTWLTCVVAETFFAVSRLSAFLHAGAPHKAFPILGTALPTCQAMAHPP